MGKHEATKGKDNEILKKNCRDDFQLPAKFNDHRPGFSEML